MASRREIRGRLFPGLDSVLSRASIFPSSASGSRSTSTSTRTADHGSRRRCKTRSSGFKARKEERGAIAPRSSFLYSTDASDPSAHFPVRSVLSAPTAELIEREPFGIVSLVLFRRIVALAAFRAGQGDDH